jgi:hypothetical protein
MMLVLFLLLLLPSLLLGAFFCLVYHSVERKQEESVSEIATRFYVRGYIAAINELGEGDDAARKLEILGGTDTERAS